MYVCLCHPVTESELKQEVRNGADTLEKVGSVCGAGTCCGCCRDMIQEIIEEHSPEPINVSAVASSRIAIGDLRQVS